MASPHFPDGMTEVILQLFQYSWTEKILKDGYKAKQTDEKLAMFFKIGKEVSSSIKDAPNIKAAIANQRLKLAISLEIPLSSIPNNLTDYHVMDMLRIPKHNEAVKDPVTRMKIVLLKYLYDNKHQLPDELKVCEGNFIYIPHPKEATNSNFKGLGHIHYSDLFRTKENIIKFYNSIPK